jgi:hypothetical protein
MRPEIADLVRVPLYKELQDHPDVRNYACVAGMHRPVFWLDHVQHEDGADDIDMKETSHSNTYEVEIVTQLVSHLSKQGYYKPGQIAVLTPYLGQLRKLRNSLRNTFSVQMSETDSDDVAHFESMESVGESGGNIERKELSETVRIATVISYNALSNILRWIISKAKKPK